jgi:hypothetical protein
MFPKDIMKKGFNVVSMFLRTQKISKVVSITPNMREIFFEISTYLLCSQVPTRKSTSPITMNAIILHGKM